MHDHLFNIDKIKYIKNNKIRKNGCILCAIRDCDADVECLEVTRTENFVVTVNLYPFNPGHLMIFPKEHITSLKDIPDSYAVELHRLTLKVIAVLEEEFEPTGFNVGYNIGQWSGASIDHIHQHIVPRFKNEVGFLDVLSGTRVIVNDPKEILERLRIKF